MQEETYNSPLLIPMTTAIREKTIHKKNILELGGGTGNTTGNTTGNRVRCEPAS